MMLTPRQVAERLQVSEDTVLREIKRHRIPAVRIGRQYRIHESQLTKLEQTGFEQVEAPRPQRKWQTPAKDYLSQIHVA